MNSDPHDKHSDIPSEATPGTPASTEPVVAELASHPNRDEAMEAKVVCEPQPGPGPKRFWQMVLAGAGVTIFVVVIAALTMESLGRKTKEPSDSRLTNQQPGDGQKSRFIGRLKSSNDPQRSKKVTTDDAYQIARFFERMNRVYRDFEPDDYQAMFDSEQAYLRILERLQRDAKKDDPSLTEIAESVREAFKNNWDWHENEAFSVKSIHPLGDWKYEVVVRQKNEEVKVVTVFRYWLINDNGWWRFYDFENPNFGDSLTGRMVEWMNVREAGGWSDEQQKARSENDAILNEVARLVVSDNEFSAFRELKKIDPDTLVGNQQKVGYWVMNSKLAIGSGRYLTCLKSNRKIEQLAPNSTIMHFLNGRAFYGLAQYEKAIRSFDKFLESGCFHPFACKTKAECHLKLNQKEKAIEAYSMLLNEEPDEIGSIQKLGQLLHEVGGDMNQLAQAFEAYPDKETGFHDLVTEYEKAFNWPAIRSLVEQYGKSKPDDVHYAYYRARELIDDRKYREACNLLKPHLEKLESKVDDPRSVLEVYARAALQIESLESLYESLSPKRSENLVVLGRVRFFDSETLFKLCQLYEKDKGRDGRWLLFYCRALHLSDQSDELFKLIEDRIKEVAVHPDADHLFQYLQTAGAASGRSVKAYELSVKKKSGFLLLARTLTVNEKWDELEQLIAARQDDRASDYSLPYFRARVFMSRNQPEQAWQVLKKLLQKRDKNIEYGCYEWFAKAAVQTGKLRESFEAAKDRKTMVSAIQNLPEIENHLAEFAAIIEALVSAEGESATSVSAGIDIAMMRKQWKNAVNLFLLNRKPYAAQLNYYSYQIFRAMDEDQQAEQAVEYFKHDPDVIGYFAESRMEKDDIAGIEKAIRLLEKYDPQNALAQRAAVRLMICRNQIEEALKQCNQELKSLPDSKSVYEHEFLIRQKFECLLRLNRFDELNDELAQVDEWIQDHFKLPIYMIQGDLEKAEAWVVESTEYELLDFKTIESGRLYQYAKSSEKGKQIAEALARKFAAKNRDEKEENKNENKNQDENASQQTK